MDPVTAVAVVLAVTAGALAQSVSGIGFSLVSGPLLVAVLGPADGVRLGIVLSMAVNAVVLARERRSVRLGDGLLLLLPAALATPLWAALARRLDDRVAAGAAGAAAVLGAAALGAGLRWRAARGRVGAVGAGLVSSLMNVVAAIGGPAVALWAANAGWSAAASRATLQLYFLGLNLVALAALGPPDVPVLLVPVCLGGVAVGLAVGARLARRVDDEAARRVTLGLAAAGGLVVLVRSLL